MTVPRFVKFPKELCPAKRKLKGDGKIRVGEDVLKILQRRLPLNARILEQLLLLVLLVIGNTRFERAMLYYEPLYKGLCLIQFVLNACPFSNGNWYQTR